MALISSFGSFIVGNQVNPKAMWNIQEKSYIVFYCLIALLFVLVWLLFPETRGHTLDQIREVFEGRPAVPCDKFSRSEYGEGSEKGTKSKIYGYSMKVIGVGKIGLGRQSSLCRTVLFKCFSLGSKYLAGLKLRPFWPNPGN